MDKAKMVAGFAVAVLAVVVISAVLLGVARNRGWIRENPIDSLVQRLSPATSAAGTQGAAS